MDGICLKFLFIVVVAFTNVSQSHANRNQGSSTTSPKCCEVCPQHFYEDLALIEVPLSHKLHAVHKFHAHFESHKKRFVATDIEDKEDNFINFVEEKAATDALASDAVAETSNDGVFSLALMHRKGGSSKKGGKKPSAKKSGSKGGQKSTAKKKSKSSSKVGQPKKSKAQKKSKSSSKVGNTKKSKAQKKSKSGSKVGNSKAQKKSKSGSKVGTNKPIPGAPFPEQYRVPITSPEATKPVRKELEPVPIDRPPEGKLGSGNCCPICAADFLPPTDYREITEPAGSTHVWTASFLQTSLHSTSATRTSGDSLPKKEKTKGERMEKTQNVNRDIPCCDVCVAQFYPPRDYMDATEFIEIMENAKSKARNNLHTGGPAVPCGCRLCQYKLTGSYTSLKEHRTPQTLPLKRPRNPMNHRGYAPRRGGSNMFNSLSNAGANLAIGAAMNALRI